MADQLSELLMTYYSRLYGYPAELDYISPQCYDHDALPTKMLNFEFNSNLSQMSQTSLVEQQGSGVPSRKQYWSQEQSDCLVQLRQEFPKYTFKDIANMLNLKFATKYSPSQCQQRYSRVADPNLYKGRFTAEEDAKIVELFRRYNGEVKLIAREMGNRQVGQIRRHLQVLGLID